MFRFTRIRKGKVITSSYPQIFKSKDPWSDIHIIIHEYLEDVLGIDTDDLDLVSCLDLVESHQYWTRYNCIYEGIHINVYDDGEKYEVYIEDDKIAEIYPERRERVLAPI